MPFRRIVGPVGGVHENSSRKPITFFCSKLHDYCIIASIVSSNEVQKTKLGHHDTMQNCKQIVSNKLLT